MKRTLYPILLALLLIGTNVLAQTPSSGQNYIMQTVVKRGGHKVKDSLSSFAVDSVNRTISYFDGLGRPVQTVQWQASPNRKDVISINVYDALGREAVKYLPYADSVGNDCSYRTTALTKQAAYYGNSTWDTSVVKTPYPFSKAIFEASPINRLLEQGAQGATWQPYNGSISGSGHTVRTWQGTNGTGEVLLWANTSTGAESTTTYTAGTLYKTVSKDENWTSGKTGTVAEFKDLDGKVVLRRQWTSNTDSLSTYYTYDVFGNLRYVVPPAVTALSFDEVGDSNFSNYIYAYHYDGHQRLMEKHVPAKGWEWMVYNVNDQVVLTQDAVLKGNNQWLFTKYDALGRTVVTGLLNSSSSRTTWQASFDSQTYLWEAKDPLNGSGAGTGYTNVSLPTSSISAYHTMNYYDDYYFHGNSFGGPNGSQVIAERTRGLQTGQKTAILGSGTMLLSVNYFDGEGRVLQVRATNHLSGADTTSNAYNFAGELVSSTRRHRVGGATTIIADSLIYDHVGRKISTRENINNQGQVVLNRLDYNGIGQLRKKNLHSTNSGSTFMQYSILAYNERGWLKKSTSPEFRMQLDYQDGTYPQYNGNIANQHWGTSLVNEFVYQYDPLNRLTNGTSTGIVMSEILAYDVMGNITSMSRYDGTTTKTGTYNYTGNQLTSISGGALATGSYAYDATGNATTDGRLGATVAYNFLKLPTSFSKGGGTPISLTYVYDATGKKLQKINAIISDTTNYIDGIQYTNHHLDFIQTEEGKALNSSGTYAYQYDLKDHLGNVRYTFDIYGGVVRKLQEDNYYPFGLRRRLTGGSNNYLYNGKEQQSELGLTGEDGQYDYGARFYDAVIGRWNVVDPLSEMGRRWSPYNYALNSPIRIIDPDGMWGLDANGNWTTSDSGEIAEFLGSIKSGDKNSDDDDPKKRRAFLLGAYGERLAALEAEAVAARTGSIVSRVATRVLGLFSMLMLSGDNVSSIERQHQISERLVEAINQGDEKTFREWVDIWNKDERNKGNRIVFRYLSSGEFKNIYKTVDGEQFLLPFDQSGSIKNKYITPDVYFSSRQAKSKLALPNSPNMAVFTFERYILPSKSPSGAGVYSRVREKFGEPGGGREAIITQPFPVIGAFGLVK